MSQTGDIINSDKLRTYVDINFIKYTNLKKYEKYYTTRNKTFDTT